MSDDKNLEKIDQLQVPQLIELYQNNPNFRAFIGFLKGIPIVTAGISLLDEGLIAKVNETSEQREAIFFQQLKGDGTLSEEITQRSEFVHRFSVVYSAAIRTERVEKIRRLARLLASSFEIGDDQTATEKFEEFTSILGEITERELAILRILKHYEKEYENIRIDSLLPAEVLMKYFETAKAFWGDFVREIEDKLGISTPILVSMLHRQQSRGLYQPYLVSSYDVGVAEYGRTTELFDDFFSWIVLENERLDRSS